MKDVFYKLEIYHLLKDILFPVLKCPVSHISDKNKIDNVNKVNSKPSVCNAFAYIMSNTNLAIPQ